MTATVVGSGAVLRGGPAATAVRLEDLPAGTPLAVLGPAATDDRLVVWWQVQDPAPGPVGWVEATHLRAA